MRLLTIGAMQQQGNIYLAIPDDYFARYKANSITGLSDGDKISQWNDLSGNGHHLVQSDPNLQPIYSILDFPTVNFTPNQHLANTWAFTGTAIEAHLLIRIKNDPPETALVGGLWLIGTQAGSVPTVYPFTDSVIYDSFGTSARKTTGDPGIDMTNWHHYNPLSLDGEWTSRMNGNLHYNTETNTLGVRPTWALGTSAEIANNNRNLDGYIAELIIYDRKLTDTERLQIERYYNRTYL